MGWKCIVNPKVNRSSTKLGAAARGKGTLPRKPESSGLKFIAVWVLRGNFTIIAFDYTEAAFKAVHFIWTMFHIVAIEYPMRHRAVEPRSGRL